MSKPEPIEEPSLEESLAMVRRMLAEGMPPARPAAVKGGEAAGLNGTQAPALEPIFGARPAVPEPAAVPPRGRLADALRSVATYPPEQEKLVGLGAVDDDLADLMDTSPLPRKAPTPPGAVVKDLAPMDLRGRARVAPSFDGDPRASRPRPETSADPAARLPSLDAAEGPALPTLPGPAGTAARESDPFQLPMGRSPASRLPSLDVTESPEAPSAPAGSATEPAGWPRGAVRSEPELPGLVSAPPTEPVIIAAMPAASMAPPPAPMAIAPAVTEGETERDAAVPPIRSADVVAARERPEDSRFELIAAIGPAVAVVKAEPEAAEAIAPELEAGPDEVSESAITHAEISREPEGGAIEVIATSAPEISAPEVIAAAEPETPGESPVVAEPAPLRLDDTAVVTAAVDEVASVLDRLVAGLSAGSATGFDLSKPLMPAPAPVAVDEEQDATSVAGEHEMETAPAPSVVASAEAFIGGVHPAHGLAPADGPADVAGTHDGLGETAAMPSADAMLKLVGTSVAIGHEGAIEARGEVFDDTVAELLRPMLRKWLESNMPRIVEKALRKELAELQADIQKAAEDDK